MHVSLAVDIASDEQDLAHVITRLVFLERAALNVFEQFATGANLHDDVLTVLVTEVLVHLNDVGVVKVLVDGDLVLENVLLVRVEAVPRDDFDRSL